MPVKKGFRAEIKCIGNEINEIKFCTLFSMVNKLVEEIIKNNTNNDNSSIYSNKQQKPFTITVEKMLDCANKNKKVSVKYRRYYGNKGIEEFNLLELHGRPISFIVSSSLFVYKTVGDPKQQHTHTHAHRERKHAPSQRYMHLQVHPLWLFFGT